MSPTRGGTLDWDDRGVLAAAMVDAGESIPPPVERVHSPVRCGTGDWDELLPPAVRLRYARGETASWDDLLAAAREEVGAAQSGPIEVTQLVFEPPGPSSEEPSSEQMLRWLAPDSKRGRR